MDEVSSKSENGPGYKLFEDDKQDEMIEDDSASQSKVMLPASGANDKVAMTEANCRQGARVTRPLNKPKKDALWKPIFSAFRGYIRQKLGEQL